ncbi:hypothetical protein [Pseudomonas veronii]|uniref:hypothetical protein n=1 Tax=Pseudomonas veronii TaxID=76761 RepID=UPI001F0CFA02|nr:hypothetical protein [Pseudomonas veronii]
MSFTSFLDNFAPGGDPFTTRLIVGDVEFTGLEVPESVTIGAKQQMVVHKLVGGKRIVDVLGVDYDNLSWSGWMTGATAGERVTALETLRDVGAPLAFSIDGYYFSVLIQSFNQRFEHVYRRFYSIDLLIVSSLDTPVTENALAGTLDNLINSDVGESLGLASIINSSSVSSAIDTVKSAVSQVQGFANATIDTVQTVIRPLVAAQAIVQSVIAQVGASVNDITTLGGLVPGNPVARAANNVLRQSAALTSSRRCIRCKACWTGCRRTSCPGRWPTARRASPPATAACRKSRPTPTATSPAGPRSPRRTASPTRASTASRPSKFQ